MSKAENDPSASEVLPDERQNLAVRVLGRTASNPFGGPIAEALAVVTLVATWYENLPVVAGAGAALVGMLGAYTVAEIRDPTGPTT